MYLQNLLTILSGFGKLKTMSLIFTFDEGVDDS